MGSCSSCSARCDCTCACSRRTAAVDPISDAIDRELAAQRKQEELHYKLLLLGAGESGKSTAVKQLKLIHRQRITEEESAEFAMAIRCNVLEVTRTILQAMTTLGVDFADPALHEVVEHVKTVEPQLLDQKTVDMIAALRQDAGFQEAVVRREEYWLLDAWEYYLDNMDRFVEPDFVPTEEDQIMTRIRTTGVICSELHDPPLRYTVVDVGGQRSERRKWIHCFDDVKAVLFLVGLSGYAQVLFEDQRTNRMVESLALFADVVRTPAFRHTPIHVLLNKKDLFETMIKNKPLSKTFPDYTGPEGEMAPALEFIKDKYRKVVETHCPGKECPIHVIAARVRLDMKVMFADVKAKLTSDTTMKKIKQ